MRWPVGGFIYVYKYIDRYTFMYMYIYQKSVVLKSLLISFVIFREPASRNRVKGPGTEDQRPRSRDEGLGTSDQGQGIRFLKMSTCKLPHLESWGVIQTHVCFEKISSARSIFLDIIRKTFSQTSGRNGIVGGGLGEPGGERPWGTSGPPARSCLLTIWLRSLLIKT